MNRYQEQEVGRHKKKSNKSVKKSNHKHDYQFDSIEEVFRFGSPKSGNHKYWVHINEKCTACGKTKQESKMWTEKELEDFKEVIKK